MTDQEVASIFQTVYNDFWLKWRHCSFTSDAQWEQLMLEARAIGSKYPQKFIANMLVELQLEIKDRQVR